MNDFHHQSEPRNIRSNSGFAKFGLSCFPTSGATRNYSHSRRTFEPYQCGVEEQINVFIEENENIHFRIPNSAEGKSIAAQELQVQRRNRNYSLDVKQTNFPNYRHTNEKSLENNSELISNNSENSSKPRSKKSIFSNNDVKKYLADHSAEINSNDLSGKPMIKHVSNNYFQESNKKVCNDRNSSQQEITSLLNNLNDTKFLESKFQNVSRIPFCNESRDGQNLRVKELETENTRIWKLLKEKEEEVRSLSQKFFEKSGKPERTISLGSNKDEKLEKMIITNSRLVQKINELESKYNELLQNKRVNSMSLQSEQKIQNCSECKKRNEKDRDLEVKVNVLTKELNKVIEEKDYLTKENKKLTEKHVIRKIEFTKEDLPTNSSTFRNKVESEHDRNSFKENNYGKGNLIFPGNKIKVEAYPISHLKDNSNLQNSNIYGSILDNISLFENSNDRPRRETIPKPISQHPEFLNRPPLPNNYKPVQNQKSEVPHFRPRSDTAFAGTLRSGIKKQNTRGIFS